MRCEPFEDLVKEALGRASHPEVVKVRSFQEAGYPKPSGVEILTAGGHSVFVQFVRGSAAGGDKGPVADGVDYTKPLAERRELAAPKPSAGTAVPQVKVSSVEALLVAALVAVAHPEVAKVETYAECGLAAKKPVGVRTTFTDGSEIFVMFLGVASAGANRFTHPDYQIPAGWL